MAVADRVVLITGAAGGIGAAAVETFRQRGWDVIAIDQAEIKLTSTLAIRADLSQLEDIDRIVDALRQVGILDEVIRIP